MAEQRNENFMDELEEQTTSFTDEDFARFERIMERRDRAALCMVIPYSRIWIDHVWLPILLVVS